MNDFKKALMEYLQTEQAYSEAEIAAHKLLSREEKREAGLLIADAVVMDCTLIKIKNKPFRKVRLHLEDNSTKMRIGDSVLLHKAEKTDRVSLTVMEMGVNDMLLGGYAPTFTKGSVWDVEVTEISMYDTFLSILDSMNMASPGAFFIEQLARKAQPEAESLFGADSLAVEKAMNESGRLNAKQLEALMHAVNQPSIQLIQGPPGTGKTHVLSLIASIMAATGKETAVIAKTHQAVNHALNAIKKQSPELNIIKIGQEYHSEGLNEEVLTFEKYNDYLGWRKEMKHRPYSDVVGMTLQAATVNMCIRNSGFKPQMVLLDEASQIPVAEAAVLGASGAGTYIFIGDDRQMPPIYVEPLAKHPLSVSIFTYLAQLYPDFKDVLNVTYRMNESLCSRVSRAFYAPYGIELTADSSARSRTLKLSLPPETDNRIKRILGEEETFFTLNVSHNCHEETNEEEALFAAQLAHAAIENGLKTTDIAIVTPFRKQANCIRHALRTFQWKGQPMPLADTVERLQGQDVEMILLSFAVTSKEYYQKVKGFLQNPNRLNVMVSRAKRKVVILKSHLIELPDLEQ